MQKIPQTKKVAIITGASGNIGKAVVKAFIKNNWQVVGTTLAEEVDGFKKLFPQAIAIELDVTDEKASRDFIKDIIDQFQNINAAIMLVGGISMGDISNTTKEDLQRMYKINFQSAFNIAQPTFTRMQQQPSGGRMVFMGARPALDPQAGANLMAYSLSKSLLFKLAEYINVSGASNIFSTVIVPSIVDTPENRKAIPDIDFDDWVKPEEIAESILFMCSEQGRSLRQSVIRIYNNA